MGEAMAANVQDLRLPPVDAGLRVYGGCGVCGEDAPAGVVQPAQLLPGASGGRHYRIGTADLLLALAGYSADVCDFSVFHVCGAVDVGSVRLEVDSSGKQISLARDAVWTSGVKKIHSPP